MPSHQERVRQNYCEHFLSDRKWIDYINGKTYIHGQIVNARVPLRQICNNCGKVWPTEFVNLD